MIEHGCGFGEDTGGLCFFCHVGRKAIDPRNYKESGRRSSSVAAVWLPPPSQKSAPACSLPSPTLSLYVNDFNQKAIRLYERVGFTTAGEFRKHPHLTPVILSPLDNRTYVRLLSASQWSSVSNAPGSAISRSSLISTENSALDEMLRAGCRRLCVVLDGRLGAFSCSHRCLPVLTLRHIVAIVDGGNCIRRGSRRRGYISSIYFVVPAVTPLAVGRVVDTHCDRAAAR